MGTEELENIIKKELELSFLQAKKRLTGGCISQAMRYDSSNGELFIKTNNNVGAAALFEGEYVALQEIDKTCTVKVPKPIKVIKGSGNVSCLVTEYLPIRSLQVFQRDLGIKLAELHLHNKRQMHTESYVADFGFSVTTCCGSIQLSNMWEKDWITFYRKHRLEPQVMLTKDESCRLLWRELVAKLEYFFEDIEIVPALLHGDLWCGNAGETDTQPVIFDPASFYGHSEFDLAIADMFGGFDETFYDGYHSVIPKGNNFFKRQLLYQLFHYLNHWNHFGGHYREKTLACIKQLLFLCNCVN